MNRYILTQWNNFTIAINYADQQLTDLHLYDAQNDSLLGKIVVGRVANLVPNIQAAFVNIDENTTCYLPTNERVSPIFCNAKNTDKICQGDLLLLQVDKEAMKTKAPCVTSNLSLTGQYVVIDRTTPGELGISKKITDKDRIAQLKELLSGYPNAQYGMILRTQAETATDEQILSEVDELTRSYMEYLQYGPTRTAYSVLREATPLWIKDLIEAKLSADDEVVTDVSDFIPAIQENSAARLTVYQDSYPMDKLYRIEETLNSLLYKQVWLKSGASIVIEPCETMTVIDINTSKCVKMKGANEDTYYKINCEAAREIAHQLRLRNISGMILIDFINMKDPTHNKELIEYLKSLIAKDSVRCQYIDMTGLGLVELTRAKSRRPIHEIYKRK